MSQESNENVIRRFYEDLWNRWSLAVAEDIVAADVRFRGSLGTLLTGIDQFRRYVEEVRAAFPDWHNRFDELIVADEKVIARLTWSGTHRGRLFGIPPTGNHVAYVGVGIFRVRDGKIREGWVVGDTHELWRALGVLSLPSN